jgi:hypothetical protein
MGGLVGGLPLNTTPSVGSFPMSARTGTLCLTFAGNLNIYSRRDPEY